MKPSRRWPAQRHPGPQPGPRASGSCWFACRRGEVKLNGHLPGSPFPHPTHLFCTGGGVLSTDTQCRGGREPSPPSSKSSSNMSVNSQVSVASETDYSQIFVQKQPWSMHFREPWNGMLWGSPRNVIKLPLHCVDGSHTMHGHPASRMAVYPTDRSLTVSLRCQHSIIRPAASPPPKVSRHDVAAV